MACSVPRAPSSSRSSEPEKAARRLIRRRAHPFQVAFGGSPFEHVPKAPTIAPNTLFSGQRPSERGALTALETRAPKSLAKLSRPRRDNLAAIAGGKKRLDAALLFAEQRRDEAAGVDEAERLSDDDISVASILGVFLLSPYGNGIRRAAGYEHVTDRDFAELLLKDTVRGETARQAVARVPGGQAFLDGLGSIRRNPAWFDSERFFGDELGRLGPSTTRRTRGGSSMQVTYYRRREGGHREAGSVRPDISLVFRQDDGDYLVALEIKRPGAASGHWLNTRIDEAVEQWRNREAVLPIK